MSSDGEYEEELKQLAAGDARIIFVGNQSGTDLRQLYTHAYLFVQASEMEGLSLSLLEAMGHGSACLASDINGNVEALADTGFFFRSRDELNLRLKLEYIFEHPLEKAEKAKAAYERACREYDWRQVAAKTAALYEELIKK